MAKRRRGHSTVFSTAQNQALRVELGRQIAKAGSQRATAEKLGIQQQNVARLVNERRAGFAYSTATMLARLAGFDGVDSFFRDRGVMPDSGMGEQANAS